MKNKRAFLVLEYAVLIAIITAGLIAMAVYFRRGLCGKLRDAGDTFGHGRQYPQGRVSVPAR